MAKKGMKRPGYTGPEAQNQNPTANPQNSTGKDAKNKSNPNQTYRFQRRRPAASLHRQKNGRLWCRRPFVFASL